MTRLAYFAAGLLTGLAAWALTGAALTYTDARNNRPW